MYRDEVVSIMCMTVANFNRHQAKENGMDSETIEQFIEQSADQMRFVNGLLYDTLKTYGVIV
jgi:hypothetical protein